MRLLISLLGWELDLTLAPEQTDDTARDLSGGNLGSVAHEPDPTDLYLGFTNGRGET